MPQVPAFPQRDPFFDPRGNLTQSAKVSLRQAGVSEDFFRQIAGALNVIALNFPQLKWFQSVQENTNAASDLALLGAAVDEGARGGQIQTAQFGALLSLLQPNERQALADELQALKTERSERAISDPEARLLAVTERGNERPVADQLLAATILDNPRTDFRAFVLEDTHAKRVNGNDYPAKAFEIGQLFVETDRLLLYVVEIVANVKQWVYVAGTMADVQASIAAIAAALGVNDTGLLLNVTDYKHLLKWTGSAFDFAPGESSGYVVGAKAGNAAPNGGLWGKCDGTSYNVLQGDGSLVSTATLNLTGDVFLKGGYTTGAQQIAKALKWAAGDKTDLANTGGSVSTASGTVNAGAGAPATFLTSATFNEGNHQHGLSDASAPQQPPDETVGGLPLRIGFDWYMRR